MHEASYSEAEPVVAIAQKRSFESSESLKKFETARIPLLRVHTVMTGALADKLAAMAYKRKGEA